MKCQEAINLWSSYRDGELDRGFRGEIEQHLETCAECRHFFAAQGEFDAALAQALKQGSATESLWQGEETAVRAAFVKQARPRQPAATPWLAWLWPSPRFYGGLAAIWLVLLIANRMADFSKPVAGSAPEFTPEQQAALVQQRRELNALLLMSDFRPPPPAVNPPGPRSDRQPEPSWVPIGLSPVRHEPQYREAEFI